jgi:ribose-phosphate pyrophosphokinase
VPNESVANRVVGDVTGKTCILQDDMIDTGGTITKAADALFDAGAADVIIAATHAVLLRPGVDRLKNSRVSEVVVTDTLPIADESASTSSPCSRSRLCWPAASARSSTTGR